MSTHNSNEACLHSAIAPNMNRCIKCGKNWDGDKWVGAAQAVRSEASEGEGS